VKIRENNQKALALVKNLYLHKRSKYINICYYYIRNLSEKKRIQITYVLIKFMFANGLTKLFERVAFERYCCLLKLVKKKSGFLLGEKTSKSSKSKKIKNSSKKTIET
jgi:hypothetical protein